MSDYLQRLQERQAVAEDFDRAMVERYGTAAHDCTTWEDFAAQDYLDWRSNAVNPNFNQAKGRPFEFCIDEYTGKLAEFPSPLPHSPKFLHRFCELITGRSVDIIPTLEWLFDAKDEADTDYILGLVSDIEKAVRDSQWLYSANGLGRLCPIIMDFSGELSPLPTRAKASLVLSKTAAEDKRNKDSIGAAYAWQYMQSGVPLFDCQELRDGIGTVRNWLSRQKKESTIPDSTDAPSSGPTYGNFYDALIGGFTPELLNALLGSQHLGMYDFENHRPTLAAKSGAWASLFWALKLRSLISWELSAAEGANLLKSTFGTGPSKTRITDVGRDNVDTVTQSPVKGTKVDQIYTKLGEPAMQPQKTPSSDK
ncbi:hypothetical protein [Hymenobacter sp. DG01]|uniref:hypothetical protein n=1 Tax=Hymenobacter sp. DG01 TaxID=2584940 RepID=UPI001123BB67|nr:hypothetical protein [Hymenobacter sp. DG01]